MMGLLGTACVAAKEFLEACPDAIITSGKRSIGEQAAAMSKNIVKQRDWIDKTYRRSYASEMCQIWVDRNPMASTAKLIEAGLLEVMKTLTYTQLNNLSKHLGGMAFDVLPPDTDRERKCTMLKNIVEKHGGKFLDHEGNLCIWHAQF